MARKLVRHFVIRAQPHQFLWLASQPHRAPHYLNFLTDIRPSEAKQCGKLDFEKFDWRQYKVWVQYRHLLKAQGFVRIHVDGDSSTVHLNHDGNLAQFEAAFCVEPGLVTMTCHYEAKIPLVSWLISKVLDRALDQIAAAMDSYAVSSTLGPQ